MKNDMTAVVDDHGQSSAPLPSDPPDESLIAFYVRLTRRESFNGDSARVQELRFQEELDRRPEWSNHEVFAEPGPVTGEAPEAKRPALQRMMEMARRGQLQAVVVRERLRKK